MTTAGRAGAFSVVARRRRRTAVRRWARAHPLVRHSDRVLFVGVLVAVCLVALAILRWPHEIPPFVFGLLVVFAGVFLPERRLLVACALVVACFVALLPVLPYPAPLLVLVGFSLLAIMGMMWLLAHSRSRLGTTGVHGENMLVDLRDRIAGNGALPALPPGWAAEVSVRSANGEAFSGDFLVSSLSIDGHCLEVALVDVSGKGREAGTRALLLSGAMGGLIASVPPEEFLPAANAYLIRQRWAEGFATAAHVLVDLRTGDFSMGTAGHPAPAQYLAGSGTWRLVAPGGGPLLGVMAGVAYPRTAGHLDHGDALLLYSDGIIESRGHDLVEGVDRMLGAATEVMIRGGSGLAEAVSRVARSGSGDDRAALAILRR